MREGGERGGREWKDEGGRGDGEGKEGERVDEGRGDGEGKEGERVDEGRGVPLQRPYPFSLNSSYPLRIVRTGTAGGTTGFGSLYCRATA